MSKTEELLALADELAHEYLSSEGDILDIVTAAMHNAEWRVDLSPTYCVITAETDADVYGLIEIDGLKVCAAKGVVYSLGDHVTEVYGFIERNSIKIKDVTWSQMADDIYIAVSTLEAVGIYKSLLEKSRA